MAASYCEPTVLWRLVRGRRVARAVVVPHPIATTLVVFLDDAVETVVDATDWTEVLEYAAASRGSLLEQGWTNVS